MHPQLERLDRTHKRVVREAAYCRKMAGHAVALQGAGSPGEASFNDGAARLDMEAETLTLCRELVASLIDEDEAEHDAAQAWKGDGTEMRRLDAEHRAAINRRKAAVAAIIGQAVRK